MNSRKEVNCMQLWKSFPLLLAALAMLSACGSGGSSTDSTTTSTAPASFYTHNAVFLNNTTVYTWGSNESGQLGNGTTAFSSLPIRVARFSNYSSGNGVATGSNHTLAFQKYSTVRAWGFNGYGQLGNGVTADKQTPNSKVPVAVRKKGRGESLSGVVAVAAGGYFSLALDRNGNVWSWGNNFYGQLGRQPYINNGVFVHLSSQTADKVQTETQTTVNGSPIISIKAIAAGGSHALALDSEGAVWGWGYNGYGQVGDVLTTKSNTIYPVKVPFLDPPRAVRIVKIAAGGSHSLALDSEGYIWGWGYNYFGQLGNGLSGENTYSATPEKIAALRLDASALIVAGVDHSLAYDPINDTLYAWGFNLYGQLGTSTTANSSTPVPVKDPVNVINNFRLKAITGTLPVALVAAGHHSHARMVDGSWWSWGDNISGQLGDATHTNRSIPVRVKGF